VLDGVGVGELPDAFKYSDQGSNTLGNLARVEKGLHLPNFEKLGLGNITPIEGISPKDAPLASFGKMNEASFAKDSTTGHWEIAGIKVEIQFPFFPQGFPKRIVDSFLKETGLKGILGNYAASGTEILKELGAEHVQTGYPIIYTSADSVFQIAAHEKIIPLNKLYEICTIAREKIFVDVDAVGRVIARPFTGEEGNFKRTTNRRDFSLNPPSSTILDYCLLYGIDTYAIGKINDLFNYKGIKYQLITKSNQQGIEKILDTIKRVNNSFIFTNLVDFDVYYGHRNDSAGFHKALKDVDYYLPDILNCLDPSDRLVFTADHGNDPTDISTDHTREYVPLIYYRKGIKGIDLGVRKSFSDIGQTVAHFFRINNDLAGTSFLNE